jgi:hypothetical protein
MLSEVFWSFFITSIVGFLVVVGRMLYKSKCKEFSFCCFKIVRDVNLEAEIDEEMIENGVNPSDSTKDIKKHIPLKPLPKMKRAEEDSKDMEVSEV